MSAPSNAQATVAVAAATLAGAAMAWAGSDGGDRVGAMPVFALCGALAFAINWLAFIPSALARTERYYDLVGGLSYVSVTVVAVLLSGRLDRRAWLVAAMVLIWSLSNLPCRPGDGAPADAGAGSPDRAIWPPPWDHAHRRDATASAE